MKINNDYILQISIYNCTIYNKTKLIVKQNGATEIAQYISQDNINSTLIVYGKQSIKKSGLYDKIVKELDKYNILHYDLSGVRANPEINLVYEGVKLIKENNIQSILTIGGGSCFDTAKAISASCYLNITLTAENIWQYLFIDQNKIEKALPIYGVLTISATASEANNGCVIQNDKLQQKWAYTNNLLYPTVSIIDATIQYSLPWFQTVNGLVDAITHIMEQITNIDKVENIMTNFMIDIGLIKSIIYCGNQLQINPQNYEARANFCIAATFALNGLSGTITNGGDWAVHFMEHALSAYNPQISHGAGLGVVFQAFTQVNINHKKRIHQYDMIAQYVFGKKDHTELLNSWRDMLKNWGHPLTLNELFGREVSQKERTYLTFLYMKRPICGYEEINQEFALECFNIM